MLAQRCPDARIDAIDIDEAAVEQARENFEHSVFSHQLSAFRSSLQNWQNPNSQFSILKCYDIIVANPPYFQNSLKNPDKGRELARHTDSLSYEELISHSARLLAGNGRLALILPAESETGIRQIAATHGLRLAHVTRVYSKESKPARRVLMAFEMSKSQNLEIPPVEDSLILENETGGRSAAYSELCKEFYL
jgi:tRNA1Val (adenine37-N6)-methyltransferase